MMSDGREHDDLHHRYGEQPARLPLARSGASNEEASAVQYEEFVAAHLKCGRSIFDLFPATPEYERWMAVGRPPIKYTLRSQLAGARRSMASP